VITDLLADLRYSLRTLTQTPLLATTAISALTLGIGFSVSRMAAGTDDREG
jgi:hypothetical protein